MYAGAVLEPPGVNAELTMPDPLLVGESNFIAHMLVSDFVVVQPLDNVLVNKQSSVSRFGE